MVFFNANELFFALLLSCPTKHYQHIIHLFDDAKDPFFAPSQTLPNVGDINTGWLLLQKGVECGVVN